MERITQSTYADDDDLFCCPQCGSTDVWEKLWHESNNMANVHEYEPLDRFYCVKCDDDCCGITTVAEFKEAESDPEDGMWCCPKCGSTNVMQPGWINVNDDADVDYDDGYVKFYCTDCEESTRGGLMTVAQFKKSKR